jgi:diaminohydroxyphosphoribosylaminopyrimidine deaminase/5-amino-6-(5-phosphoribosylamino)uracil reductase
VIAAGIQRVIVAMEDPDPRVAGRGIARLRSAGMEVLVGVEELRARALNAAFCHRVHRGRPLGVLKWAMSVDGRTALPNGASQWVSGPEARGWVHRLRARCDAVIVGGGTVRADDPLLTSRGLRAIEPLRVVISRGLQLPEQAQLWDQRPATTLVAHGPEAPGDGRRRLEARGVERLELSRCEPRQLLEALAERGCNQVLWECGAELAAAALRQGCVQRIAAVVAPKVLGGAAARTPVGDLQLTSMAMAPLWGERRLSRSGADLIWDLSVPEPVSGSEPAP